VDAMFYALKKLQEEEQAEVKVNLRGAACKLCCNSFLLLRTLNRVAAISDDLRRSLGGIMPISSSWLPTSSMVSSGSKPSTRQNSSEISSCRLRHQIIIEIVRFAAAHSRIPEYP